MVVTMMMIIIMPPFGLDCPSFLGLGGAASSWRLSIQGTMPCRRLSGRCDESCSVACGRQRLDLMWPVRFTRCPHAHDEGECAFCLTCCG